MLFTVLWEGREQKAPVYKIIVIGMRAHLVRGRPLGQSPHKVHHHYKLSSEAKKQAMQALNSSDMLKEESQPDAVSGWSLRAASHATHCSDPALRLQWHGSAGSFLYYFSTTLSRTESRMYIPSVATS